MKVLISDYSDSMMPTHDIELETLRAGLGEDLEVEIYEYSESAHEQFIEKLADADALLTAFIPVTAEVLDAAPALKVVSINATGYDNVDLAAATQHGVGVCPVGEYCTWDVSEAAIAYMFALNKHVKFYQEQIDKEHIWDYAAAPAWPRLENQTLGIVGFGKIGKCTARKARGLVERIVAYDPYVSDEAFAAAGVERVEIDELLAESDIIVNHMCLTGENTKFFDADKFAKMKRKPILINLGRGLSVDESALLEALDNGAVRSFGADVLYDETPDLANHPLVGRSDVIITPHSAFYSTTSLEDLMRLSCLNIVYYLTGEKDKVFKLVN